jgi:hypothetical protein
MRQVTTMDRIRVAVSLMVRNEYAARNKTFAPATLLMTDRA